MRSVNKLLTVTAVFISLTGMAFADSTGIVFDWQPFVINNYLDLNYSRKNTLPKDLFTSGEIWKQFYNVEELLNGDLKTINNSFDVTAKKSPTSKIKITFSSVNSFMVPGDEMYSRGKDGKLIQATRILPSLVRNPSQETAVETLKLIEPQINFGFEF
ncbi:MAG: hypothetical protein AB2L12_16285 [Smithellaceae bacterium]